MDKIADTLVKLLSRFIKFQKQPEYLRGKKDSTKGGTR